MRGQPKNREMGRLTRLVGDIRQQSVYGADEPACPSRHWLVPSKRHFGGSYNDAMGAAEHKVDPSIHSPDEA
jgi:hypothetical protein